MFPINNPYFNLSSSYMSRGGFTPYSGFGGFTASNPGQQGQASGAFNPLVGNTHGLFGGGQQAPSAAGGAGGGLASVTNQLGGIATPAIGFATSIYGAFNDNTTDPLIDSPDLDADNPTLSANSYLRNMANNSNAEAKAAGNAGILNSAGSGAALGTAIAPGIGTVIGAGIGAIAGAFGKRRRKRRAKKQREKAKEQYQELLTNYNTAKYNDIVRDNAMERAYRGAVGPQQFPRSTFSLI